MIKKISITAIFLLLAFCNVLVAGQEVNIEVVSMDLPEAPSGFSSEGEVDFIAPGTGKYKIVFEFVYENILSGPVASFTFGIEEIYPYYHTGPTLTEYIDDWMEGWPQARTIYVDLEGGVEYTLYAWFYNAAVTVSDVTVTAIYLYAYERDFMVSLPLDIYFQNVGDFITFNPLMTYENGSYFDFTGYLLVGQYFWNHPNFQMYFQGTIDDTVTIYPPLCAPLCPDPTGFFQETYNPSPFLNNCSNTVTYLGDFEMFCGDFQADFSDRMFNFEYAPNYGNLTEDEFTVTSSQNCHPLLQWPAKYADFFTQNELQDYFETQICRKKVPYGGSGEDWNVIATIPPDMNSYEDTELESPDPNPGYGYFGIEGIARYKIRLQQTPANPNVNEDWAQYVNDSVFVCSPTHSIYYGQNSGGGALKPMLYGVFNLNVTGFHHTTISFVIKDDAYANTSVKIYNIRGQLVKTLLDEPLGKGCHTLVWDGTGTNNRTVSSGIYLMQICRGNERVTKKISLLR